MAVKHAKTSGKTNPADPTIVGGQDWDAAHTTEGAVELLIDGGGIAITTGIKADVVLPFAGTITGATLLADQSGSIVLDLWKDTYANFPPTVADTITSSAKPTLATALKSTDTTLTGWTKTFAKGDVLRVKVDSVATVTRVLLSLAVTEG